jgi:prepilin-type N-terminal cleavage/methylation domain-containing protein/prepilin-type processing-associated H-X9-DG protein
MLQLSHHRRRKCRGGFSLIELLVVIAIIAILIGILLPSLRKARVAAQAVASLSNLRQLHIAVQGYKIDSRGIFPLTWPQVPGERRIRWADAVYPYLRSTEIYMSPQLDEHERRRMSKPFGHTLSPDGTVNANTIFWGGYGYNYQYLGNGRHSSAAPAPYNEPFFARDSSIRASARTVVIADTQGCKDGWDNAEGVYQIDPPLQSLNMGSKGSRKSLASAATVGNYGYQGGNDGEPPTSDKRAMPAERNVKRVNAVFCDGHAEALTRGQLDDSNSDGIPDNGYWNGKGDPLIR